MTEGALTNILDDVYLNKTGDMYANKYFGKIYINKSDTVIVKNETTVQSTDYSTFGRSFFSTSEGDWKPKVANYTFTTTYTKNNNFYYLNTINYTSKVIYKNSKDNEKTTTNNAELKVLKTVTKNPEIITNRCYFENVAFDEIFWKNF